MTGSVYVPFTQDREVFIDTKKCGMTNIPFSVEVGTHNIDLGSPPDYSPVMQQIVVLSSHTPLAPLVVHFQEEEEEENA